MRFLSKFGGLIGVILFSVFAYLFAPGLFVLAADLSEDWESMHDKKGARIVSRERDRIFINKKEMQVSNHFRINDLESTFYRLDLNLMELIDDPTNYQSFYLLVKLNGKLIKSLSSERTNSERWVGTSVYLPEENLHEGDNGIILELDRDLDSHYLAIGVHHGASNKGDIPQNFCIETTYSATKECLPYESSYTMWVKKRLNLKTEVDSRYLPFLDDEKYTMLNCPIDRAAWGPQNQYFVNLLNVERVETLRAIPAKGKNDYEKAVSLMNYLYNHYSPIVKGGAVFDFSNNSAYELLFTEGKDILWCSHIAYALVALAYLNGIDGRPLFLYHPDRESGHVATELYIDGKWVFFDPFANITFEEDGKRYSAADIQRDREVFENFLLRDFPSFAEPNYFDSLTPYFDHLDSATIGCGSEKIPYYEGRTPPEV